MPWQFKVNPIRLGGGGRFAPTKKFHFAFSATFFKETAQFFWNPRDSPRLRHDTTLFLCGDAQTSRSSIRFWLGIVGAGSNRVKYENVVAGIWTTRTSTQSRKWFISAYRGTCAGERRKRKWHLYSSQVLCLPGDVRHLHPGDVVHPSQVHPHRLPHLPSLHHPVTGDNWHFDVFLIPN